MKDKATNLIKMLKNFIMKNYYIFLAIFLLIYTIVEYRVTDRITIYCIFYFALSLALTLVHLFKNKLKKNIVINFFPKNKLMIVIFLIVIITSINCFKENNDRVLYQQVESSGVIEPILVNPYYQEIYTKDISINEIAIRFATYSRVNNAEYKFRLLENDNVLVERDFNANQLLDGKFFRFRFDYIKLDANKNYKIEVIPIHVTGEHCITIFQSLKNNEINYMMLSTATDYVKIISILIFMIIFCGLNYIINTKKLTPQKFYMLCGIYLLSIMFIIPPWNVPDEPVHYYRAYKLSQISINKSLEENLNGSSIYGPSEWCINYSEIEAKNKVYSRSTILDCLKDHKNITKDRDLVTKLSYNSPVNHMFAAIGIKIVDIFTNSPLIIFFAGRLANLIISFIIIYFAIKMAPKNKLVILFVATIPMFVQQMASYSYDSVLNASCLFVLSYVMSLYDKDKWKIKDFLLMVIMAIFIFSAKNIYIFIFVPLLFKKLENKKEIIKTIGMTLLVLAVAYEINKIWPVILGSINDANSTTVSTASSMLDNRDYLLKNPLQIFPLIYNTFAVNGWFYLRSLFGYFGWFVFSIENIYIWIYLIMMVILLNTEKLTENVFNGKQKIASVIAFLIMFAAPFAAMYFYWSSYKLGYVDGVQGRYFLPLLGLLIVTLVPKKQRKVELEEKDIFTFINMMFIMFIILLICKFY